MKRILIFSFLLFCALREADAQSAFNDALKLRKLEATKIPGTGKLIFDEKDSLKVVPVLLRYLDAVPENYIKLRNIYNSNPFITMAGSNSASVGPRAAAGITKGLLGSLGKTNVTTFADGLGKFLAERTKEELNVAFFERFRDNLKSHPELGAVFPATTVYLNTILNHEYNNMLSTLKEAFLRDLKSLPRNMASISDLDTAKDCTGSRNEENCKKRIGKLKKFFENERGTFVITALLIADGAVSNNHPADILSAIASNKTIEKASKGNDFAGILKLADILSSSLRSEDKTRIWVSRPELEMLVKDDTLFTIYTGLVYQKIKSSKINIKDQEVAGFIKNNQGFKTYLSNLIDKGQLLTAEFDSLKKEDKSGQVKEEKFIESFKEFFMVATNYEVINPNIPKSPQKDQIVKYTSKSLEIAQNILIKNYSAAVVSTLLLINPVLETDSQTDHKLAINSELKGDKKEIIDSLLTKLEFKQSFIKYANFMANVVAAENSDEVKKAISTVALPPGSSSIKRTHYFNMALQAYTGFTAGSLSDGGAGINTMGVYAPLGIAVSTGLKSRTNPFSKRTAGSLSLFASLIDVGAVVAYRFKDAETDLADSVKIRLENIFAPGVNLIYGIPNWPLSLGGGFQWQPSLTRLSKENATIAEKSGYRWHFFLSVDIPVLNLRTSRR
jgi:hypothetical protein